MLTLRTRHLVKKPKNFNFKVENFYLHQVAYIVESSFISAGAVANRDYSIVDVFNIAALMAIEAQLLEILNTIPRFENSCGGSDDTETTTAVSKKIKSFFPNVGYQ